MIVTDDPCQKFISERPKHEIICSPTFHEHPYADEILKKVTKAIEYFPEITTPIQLARHGTKGANYAIAYVRWHGVVIPEINFNIRFNSSMNTIFHEIGHVLQYSDREIPFGEESCSIFALARMPTDLVDSNKIPYIGLVPMDKVQYYCKMALDQRNNQKCRSYIKWLRERLRHDHDPLTWPKFDVFREEI